MATTAVGTDFYKLVATAGVPVALGLAATKFSSITFVGCKSAKTNNTDTVYIRFAGGTGWLPLAPGNYSTWDSKDSRPFTAAMFELDSVTNGDGVLAITQNPPNTYDGPA